MVMSSLEYMMMRVICLSVAMATPVYSMGSHDEAMLISSLLNSSRYSVNAKPRDDPSQAVDVSISLEIHTLTAMDFTSQTMEWMGWLRIQWYDEFLQFDPTEYGNVQRFYVPATSVWTPDVLALNSVNQHFNVEQVLSPTKAEVDKNGRVVWMTTAVFVTSCTVDVALFPFDVQTCPVMFGSRTQKVHELVVRSPLAKADYSQMVRNGQWQVQEIPAEQRNMSYPVSDGFYSTVVYKFVLRRKPLFYLFHLLLPGLLVLLVGLGTFLLPTDSVSKVTLSVTALLTMVVLLLVVMDNIPPHSDAVPLLSMFFGVSTALLALSAVMAAVVSALCNRGASGRCPPRHLGTLLAGPLARCLCLPAADWTQPGAATGKGNNDTNDAHMAGTPLLERQKQDPPNDSSDTAKAEGSPMATSEIGAILQELRTRREEQEVADQCKNQWRVVATFVDRLGLLVVLIALLVLLLVLFL